MKKKKEIKHNIETNIINPNIDNPKHLNIFTDGSVDQQNKKAGAAAIFVSQPINNFNQMQVTEFLNIISKNPDSVIEDDSLNNTLNELYQEFQYQCPPGSGSMVTGLIAIKKALENANDTPFSNTKSIVSILWRVWATMINLKLMRFSVGSVNRVWEDMICLGVRKEFVFG